MTRSELVTIPDWQYNRLPSRGQLSGGASPYGALDMAGCRTGGTDFGQKAAVSGVADKVEVDTGAGNIDLMNQ